jgi:hypothetical protein
VRNSDILILKVSEVNSLLTGREFGIINAARIAHEAHVQGDGALPHSTFLRFPEKRIV